MKKWIAMSLFAISSVAHAELQCFYSPLPDGSRQQICYDMSKPAEAQKAAQHVDKIKRDYAPRAGVFDHAAPLREMQTNQHLQLPRKVELLVFNAVKPALSFSGIFGGSPDSLQLAGAEIIAGQEQAVNQFINSLLYQNVVLYAELTGDFKRNQREAFLWMGNNLLSVMLVERGLAKPLPTQQYANELLFAQVFAEKNKLGAYAEAK